jgi:hypothetical protein
VVAFAKAKAENRINRAVAAQGRSIKDSVAAARVSGERLSSFEFPAIRDFNRDFRIICARSFDREFLFIQKINGLCGDVPSKSEYEQGNLAEDQEINSTHFPALTLKPKPIPRWLSDASWPQASLYRGVNHTLT